MNRFYVFSYFLDSRRKKELEIHQLRDGHACLEWTPVLCQRGYEYGGPILNYPSGNGANSYHDEHGLDSSDLLVLTTRPPLHDMYQGARKQVERSNTELEEKVFASLERFFDVCSRSYMKLSAEVAMLLPETHGNRAEIVVRQHRGAGYLRLKEHEAYQQWVSYEGNRRLTAGYLIYLTETWENGPALLASFGMGGRETLIWNHLIRTRFPDILDSQVLVLGEIEWMEEGPMKKHSGLKFSEDWPVEIFLKHSF